MVRLAFLAPATIFLMFLVVYPAFATILLGFVDEDTGEFPTGENFETVLTDADTLNLDRFPERPPPWGTLIHNAIWIAIHLPVSMFTGLALALILQDFRGSSIIKGTIFVGMVTPMIVGGVILRYLYEGSVGIIPALFGVVGIEALDRNWMTFPSTALFGLVFGSVWMWVGFSLIVFSAGLTTIPKEYWEAAKIDGASPFRTFVRITFPLLKPMTLVVVTMTVLWELKIFDIVFAAAGAGGGVGGSVDVLALQMYRYAFIGLNFERAAVVASLLTLLTLLATGWMIRRLVKR